MAHHYLPLNEAMSLSAGRKEPRLSVGGTAASIIHASGKGPRGDTPNVLQHICITHAYPTAAASASTARLIFFENRLACVSTQSLFFLLRRPSQSKLLTIMPLCHVWF